MSNGKSKIELEHRLTRLETCVKTFSSKLDFLSEQTVNHLPSKIENLENKVDMRFDKLQWWIIATLASALLGIILRFIN